MARMSSFLRFANNRLAVTSPHDLTKSRAAPDGQGSVPLVKTVITQALLFKLISLVINPPQESAASSKWGERNR